MYIGRQHFVSIEITYALDANLHLILYETSIRPTKIFLTVIRIFAM